MSIEIESRRRLSLAEIIAMTGAKLAFQQNVEALWSVELLDYRGEPLLYQGHLRAGAKPGFTGLQRTGRFASHYCDSQDMALEELAVMLTGLTCAMFPNPPRGRWDIFRKAHIKLELCNTLVTVCDDHDAPAPVIGLRREQ